MAESGRWTHARCTALLRLLRRWRRLLSAGSYAISVSVGGVGASRIISLAYGEIGSDCGTVVAELIDAAVASADRFSDEQEELVSRWLTSGDRVQCAVGRAGTGKTTTMRVAARAWTTAGYRVIGATVKGEAARLLADEAEIEADTVAMLLARSDNGIRVLDSRTVLIVDEASTLGDRDLLRLAVLAYDTGATLRLIGDPAQHGSVSAGGSFTELVETFGTRGTPSTSSSRAGPNDRVRRATT